ncbi:MAG TPA: CvpA family protein [Candidatus Enterenecus stercoripullorum]|nr:CvpA family protein [Candidatus Enterenecus stercoripullorum]
MPLYLFDILILAVLVFFAWRGAKKGLILTLCSLAGIFIAFFGARLISAEFYRPVANIVEPGIYQTILGAEPEGGAAPEASAPPSYESEGELEQPAPTYTMDELLSSIHEAGLFSGLAAFIDKAAVSDDGIEASESRTPAEALAGYIAQLISKAGLFALSFLILLLGWFLVGHMLDLAFHLPILSAVNFAGGLVLGLLKAALLVIVLVWLGQLAGWIPADPDTPLLSLFTLRSLSQLLNGLLV